MSSKQRKVCVFLATRGNYGKLKSTIDILGAESDVNLQVVIGGNLLSTSHQPVVAKLLQSNNASISELPYQQRGDSPVAIAQSASRCAELATALLSGLEPDIVVLTADRYEVLALALAAVCLNVRIAHIEGGELSGSIDERIRHAITKLAHLHFPANATAAERLRRLGEPPQAIHVTGSPSFDQLVELSTETQAELRAAVASTSKNAVAWLDSDFVVVSQHPVATEYLKAREQFSTTAKAVLRLRLPVFWIRPNLDAGADAHTAAVRFLADSGAEACVLGALELTHYGALLQRARCLIGNSSSALREGAFLGVPAVNIGTRQADRAHADNVRNCEHDEDAILAAARNRLACGPFPRSTLYGDGRAGSRIAAALTSPLPPLSKQMAF